MDATEVKGDNDAREDVVGLKEHAHSRDTYDPSAVAENYNDKHQKEQDTNRDIEIRQLLNNPQN